MNPVSLRIFWRLDARVYHCLASARFQRFTFSKISGPLIDRIDYSISKLPRT